MTRARDLVFLIGGLMLGVAINAALSGDIRVEGGIGKCRASAPNEGTWQQRDQPHQIQLSDKCGEVGMVFGMNHNISIGARYVNFGQYAIYAVANNDPEDKADLRGSISNDHTRADCQKPSGNEVPMREDCHYRWNGSGHLYGGLFSVAWHPIHFGDLKIGGELGMVIYKATWRMVIQPLNGGWEYQYDQRTGWNRAPAFGASAYYKYLYTAYRVYMIPDGAPITPGYRSPIKQFVLGVSIPL